MKPSLRSTSTGSEAVRSGVTMLEALSEKLKSFSGSYERSHFSRCASSVASVRAFGRGT